MTLDELKSLIRSNPQNLTGGARGDNAFFRMNGGDMGYGLTYSPEWMNAVNDTTPYQKGDNGYFWSDGNQTYTPSALKASQLAGTANPADYLTGFNEVPSFSNDAYAGNSQWKGESFLTPALIGLAMAYGIPGLLGNGAGMAGISTADALATTGLDLGTAGAGSLGAGGGSMGFTDWLSNLVDSGSYNPGAVMDSVLGSGGSYNPGAVMDAAIGSSSSGSIPSWLSSAGKAVSGLTGGSGGSLLGTALGGLLGSVNGSKQAGTTTVTQAPWAGQQPYLLDAFERARQAANSPLAAQGQSNYSTFLNGPTTNPYLGMNNPYLQGVIDNANADVSRAMVPTMNAANYASGSFGNSGVADIMSKNLTDAYSRNATGLRFQDYTNQQNLAENAVNRTAGMTTNAQNYAAQPAQNYAQTIQGNYGGTTTTPYYNNPVSGMLGGAMIGNKIGSNLGF